jgi:hypothetical protein
VWSPKGTTLRVIRCPTLQVSQFLFPGQRSDTFLTDHVYHDARSSECQIDLNYPNNKVPLSNFFSRILQHDGEDYSLS